jgi:plasmid stabilization system protein ParE
MKRYEVVFTPEAEEQLADLYRYIEENATADVALRYTSAILTKTFITINPDGSQSWGPNGIPNDVWLRRNIRIRRMQNWGVPLSYGAVGLGFVSQLVALWLPKLH